MLEQRDVRLVAKHAYWQMDPVYVVYIGRRGTGAAMEGHLERQGLLALLQRQHGALWVILSIAEAEIYLQQQMQGKEGDRPHASTFL